MRIDSQWLNQYPALYEFINAASNLEQLAKEIDKKYWFNLDDDQCSKIELSPFSIIVELSDLNHLKALHQIHPISYDSDRGYGHVDSGSDKFFSKKIQILEINPLSHAAEIGQIEMVNYFLECQKTTNLKFNQSNSRALTCAVKNGHLQVVDLILNHMCLDNNILEVDYIAMHTAAENGHVEIIDRLLQPRNNQKIFIKNMQRVLALAAGHGHYSVMERLLTIPEAQEQASNMYVSLNHVPLFEAIKHGNISIISCLLELPGVQYQISSRKNTALLFAAKYGHISVVKKLLEYPHVINIIAIKNTEHEISYEATALSQAAYGGHTDIVDLLLTYPEVRQSVADHDNLALRFAVAGGCLPIVNRLLEFSAVQDTIGQFLLNYYRFESPLKSAAEHGHLDILNRLLEFPATQNSMTVSDYSVFWSAAIKGHLHIINRLLDFPVFQEHLEHLEFKFLEHFNSIIFRNHFDLFNRLLEINFVQQFVEEHGQTLLVKAAEFDRVHFIERLLVFPAVEDKIADHFNEVLSVALKNGFIPTVNRLLMLQKVEDNVGFIKRKALRDASAHGDLELFKRLFLYQEDALPSNDMSEPSEGLYDKSILFYAVINGHDDMVKHLLLLPDILTELEQYTQSDFEAKFRWDDDEFASALKFKQYYQHYEDVLIMAAFFGHLTILNRLLDESIIRNMAVPNYNIALCYAAENGHIDIVERLLELPEVLDKLLGVAIHKALCLTIEHGFINIVDRLLQLQPVCDVIAMNKNEALNEAIIFGQQDIFFKLLEFPAVKEQVCNISLDYLISRMNYFDLDPVIFAYLLSFESIRKNFVGKDHSLLSFGSLIHNEQFALLNLVVSYPEFINIANRTKSWGLKEAAEGGWLMMTQKILTIAPVDRSISDEGHEALLAATNRGHLVILDYLLNVEMIFATLPRHDYEVFRVAVRINHGPIIEFLLSFNSIFAYAEMHQVEYGVYTKPFIVQIMRQLRNEKIIFEAQNPQGIFDLDEDDATRCFYIVRNLIRQNLTSFDDDIRFLLEIPAVKLLAHTEVTPGMPNELICLALSCNNQNAARILIELCPEVGILARQNHYYQAQAQGHFDLCTIARDRESSLRALSTGETKRLSAVIQHYQPIITARGGIEVVFESLKSQLIKRYQNNPANIKLKTSKVFPLPLSWHDFTALALSADLREEALKAYYNNKDHTALRYLSKPNYWMSPDAKYVVQDPRNPSLRWSTFESYKELIAMLWLAADDAEIIPTDGYTLDTRVDQFIDELAHIGRGHNWDENREKVNQQGALVTEEYDNGKGDDPSCFSGTKRRLFQSVQGHPLLKILSLDDIKEELRHFVRDYFKIKIIEKNREALRQAFDKLCLENILDPCLNDLNITESSQTTFINDLETKYSLQFKEEQSFKLYITENFCLTDVFPSHVSRFAGLTNLKALLKPESAITVAESLTNEASLAHQINPDIPCYHFLLEMAFISSIACIISTLIATLALIGILNLGTTLTVTVIGLSIATAGLALHGFFNNPPTTNNLQPQGLSQFGLS